MTMDKKFLYGGIALLVVGAFLDLAFNPAEVIFGLGILFLLWGRFNDMHVPRPVPEKTCPKCNATIKGQKFCPECGTKV